MKVLQILTAVLILCLALYCVWVCFFALTGLFLKRKTHSIDEFKHRFAVIICARNEAQVIGHLIDSIRHQHYPAERFDIITVAHNCTDETANVAAGAGAKVYVLNDPEHATKGAALSYGLTMAQGYDAFVVFDADNLVHPEFLSELNHAFNEGAEVVQGFRASKNYADNLVTRLFGGMWMMMAYVQNLPHSFYRLPVTINGTGFGALFSALSSEGWQTRTLCEDIEFSVQQVLLGRRIRMASGAVFYDEQPTKIRDAYHQRLRWAVGIQQCFCYYIKPLIREIPNRGLAAFKMAMDLCLNPALIAGAFGLVLQTMLLICNGASGATILSFLGIEALAGWLMVLPMTLNMIIKEKLPLGENLGMIILMPAFLFLSGVLALGAPFCMNKVKWTPIAHASQKKIEEII